MTTTVYISTIEPGSGKAIVALGMMNIALRRTTRVGFFRPIIGRTSEGRRDDDINLILCHFNLPQSYESAYVWHQHEVDELLGADRLDEVIEKIIHAYKALERECDFILIEGTDYQGQLSVLEFDLNCMIARNLGAAVLIVGNARERSVRESLNALHQSMDAYEEKGCVVVGLTLNQAHPEQVRELSVALEDEFGQNGKLVGVFPFEPVLRSPSVREVAEQLGATVLFGADQLEGLVAGYLVGAMHLQNLLTWLDTDQLVLTPGDRADILLGVLEADRSTNYPRLAGVVLTSGIKPEPAMLQLIRGLSETLPILSVDEDTYTVASRLEHIHTDIKPGDHDKIRRALAMFEGYADLAGIERRLSHVPAIGITPRMFTYNLVQQAKSNKQHIVLPEGDEPRILSAAAELVAKSIVRVTLLGQRARIESVVKEQGVEIDLAALEIVDPVKSPMRETYAQSYYEARRNKGVTLDAARDCLLDVSYFGTMMVHLGHADGMVSGAVHTTQHTIRPALQVIKTRPGCSIVSSVFFMCLDDGVVVYGDCAVNPDPTAPELAEIAITSADTARIFGIDPKVALLSYSTGESGAGEEVEKVRDATRIARESRPDLQLEGPIQYDAAVDAGVAALKMPGSAVAGHATVFVFPDLNTGNNTYKAVQRETRAIAIGPILQGLRKPVNDLSRGCTVEDIVNTVVITAIQAQ